MLNGTQSKSILTLIAASGVGALFLVVMAAVWAGAESDVAALERQRQLVTARLNDQVSRVAHDMGLMSAGYGSLLADFQDLDASSQLMPGFQPSSHMTSAAKFGEIITRVFGYDKVFLVNSSGDLAPGADAQTVKRYKWVRPLLTTMLREVQDKEALNSKSSNETPDGELIFVSAGLMRVEGRPSITGIIPINTNGTTPLATAISSPVKRHYLIAFRFLDGAALDALSREQGLNGARFARTADSDLKEVAFQIEATANREPIGFIIWTPDLPGSRVIERLTPALSVATILVAVLFSTLIIRLRRSWRALEISEQNARHLSLRDVLTGLPNRALFARGLDEALGAPQSKEGTALVAFIDLDRFKSVNDSFGHAVGDELICSAASRMELLLGPADVLARVGGDEFALLLPTPAGEAVRFNVCETLVKELSRPFVLREGQVTAQIGCSVGMAVLFTDARSSQEILRQADVALYDAKSTGRGRCSRYDASMDLDRLDRARLADDLRVELGDTFTAEDNWHQPTSNLKVFYQTIHRAGHQDETSGAEALIRWQHPTRGLLAPDKFIPLAEDSGLIDLLGRFVLESACATASDWPDGQAVAVNVSPKQLKRPDFADEVILILEQTGLQPYRLELELTETALLESEEEAQTTLQKLRRHGVKVALDDFGTGYSSLSHLIQFGIDRIKIDRSFVRLIDTKSDGAAIIAAIAGLARTLGIATTAEGVETEGQKDFLIALGCSDLQGYLFSKPTTVDELPFLRSIKGFQVTDAATRR